jgi:UDP-2,3-diacylglucosamine pyrophosphatase LpxH
MPNNKDFVVISDFHSIYEVFFKLKYNYISEYDNIYILGDATDRGYDGNGGYGVKLLLKIMGLEKKIKSLPQNVREEHHIGNIHYIPGNHDDFLYEYALLQDENAKENLKINLLIL